MGFISRHPREDATINILSGSVRSSKTWTVNAKLLKWLVSGFWPGGVGLITGHSRMSVRTNILNDILSWTHTKKHKPHYSIGSGMLTIFGRQFLVLGASDDTAERRIKGSTVGLWIADEATLYPESFWNMAVSRLSLPLSRCYATTNPAGPYHYLKKDWMDNENKIKNREVWSDTFTLDDNPNITDEKKESFKRMFSGVFYRRNILGEWVIAEGAIYRDVIGPHTFYNDSTRPPALLSQHGHVDRWVSIDVGTINAMAMLEFFDDGEVVWVEKEYYWSSPDQGVQKTNAEYCKDFLHVFCRSYNPTNWPVAIVDPSAASFKAELNQAGVGVLNAENDVLEGIRKVSTMFAKRKVRIHERCVNLKRELETYAWDERAAKLGIGERPIKVNDHACFVAGSKVATPAGEKNIEDLVFGDQVLTPLGIAKVLGVSTRLADTVEWNGTRVTPDHKIATAYKWIPVIDYRSDKHVVCVLSREKRKTCLNWLWRIFPSLARYVSREICDLGSVPEAKKDLRTEVVYRIRTEHGCYFVNGVLVANCDALRYGLVTKIPSYRIVG